MMATHPPAELGALPIVDRSAQLSSRNRRYRAVLIGSVVGALILPPMGEIYDMGLYRVGNAQLYTTRGIGTIHVNARFNCPPEVTAITLHA